MAQKKESGIENIVSGLFKGGLILMRICSFGLRRINYKSADMWFGVLTVTLSLAILSLGPVNVFEKAASMIYPSGMPFYFRVFFSLSPRTQCLVFIGLVLLSSFTILGFKEFRRYSLFQKALASTGLKTATGEKPQVKSIISTGAHRCKVIVETFGVGLGKFEAQRDSLTAGFRQTVESIKLAQDKGKVEIYLCERDLPALVAFGEIFSHIKEPYSFVIGQSLKGPLVQSIRSLPHLLISGATGGGKSVFFRSTMLSLLKSSPHIQLYLLDLKRGVEVKEFAELPNVKTAKDEEEATNILGALVDEMNRRYTILEKNGQKSIDPKRDKLDLIVVGIDEAAALFGRKTNESARKLIGELARLARAAGIHLVPSTQKPVKDAIDTETLDNLPGRMTFRMISSAASNVAMGGNLAKKLPAIKGRAMWTNGSDHQEIQAPYLDDEEMDIELNIIKEEFESGQRKNFQKMIDTQSEVNFEEMTE